MFVTAFVSIPLFDFEITVIFVISLFVVSLAIYIYYRHDMPWVKAAEAKRKAEIEARRRIPPPAEIESSRQTAARGQDGDNSVGSNSDVEDVPSSTQYQHPSGLHYRDRLAGPRT
eukprot:GILK01002779.1.p2 GENE.GILK01002779.1~~GILK01002779.1.p2  ORF type:complete len:115 (+),score=18.84 GILK01002779.1:438-782(+)